MPGRSNRPLRTVVVVAVLELLADTSAGLEPEVGRDGDVALVEERVQVAPKE